MAYNARRQGTVQNFTLTASAQVSSPLGSQTRAVMLTCAGSTIAQVPGGAFVLINNSTSTVVTSSNGTYFPPNWVDTFDVTPGQVVQVIASSSGFGPFSVTELQ